MTPPPLAETAEISGPTTQAEPEIHPAVTLSLLSLQHALIHAQSALMPLVFIQIIDQFGVGVGQIGLLIAVGNVLSGAMQLSFGWMTRVMSRRGILGLGGLVFGGAMSLTAMTTAWIPFAATTVVARVGGSPQHPVGNALISEQYPVARRGSAISIHIALGNLGTVAIPLVGGYIIARSGWEPAVLIVGIPAIVVAVARASGEVSDALSKSFRERISALPSSALSGVMLVTSRLRRPSTESRRLPGNGHVVFTWASLNDGRS